MSRVIELGFTSLLNFTTVWLLAFAVCLGPVGGQVDAAERPNVVLVMADDQGWGDMAYNGHPTVQTPNFDEAAASGVRFDRFYAAAPVCSPTRASVMTGRHPNRMGVFKWGYPIRPQEITIAEALKQAGYVTAHFGKWHLGSVRRESPVHPGHNGFDEWLSAPNFYDNDPVLSHRGTAVRVEGESSLLAADAAIEWMQSVATTGQPFLAVVWFGSPHNPHRAAEKYAQMYPDQSSQMRNFLGEITAMDEAFGRIRQSLRDMRVQEDTVLWYCSDNGGLPRVGSVGPFRGRKGSVYEGGLLVPAFLEWPAKLVQPKITAVRCSTSDIYPTILDIVDVQPEAQPPLDGISLLPLLEESQQTRQKPIGFWDYTTRGISTPSAQWMPQLLRAQQAGKDLPPHQSSLQAAELPDSAYPNDRFPGHAAWIDGDWKLHRIEKKNGEVVFELYNLATDPSETMNLFRNDGAASADADRIPQMQAALEHWLGSVVDSLNGQDY